MATEGRKLRINGHELHVEEAGPQDGPVVVLLHHGLGSVRAWKAQIAGFSAAGKHVIAYDRWGYGRSAARPEFAIPYFEEDVDDLEVLLDTLGVQQAALIGHSDGGTVALYFAACRPQRLERLVTIAAHIYIEPKMDTGIQAVRHSFETDRLFRNALRSVHGDKTDAVFYGWFNGWHRRENLGWDMRAALPQIACQTLVIQGSQDEHATLQHAQDIAAGIRSQDGHPGVELWLVEGANHMFPQERPEEFNQRVLAFLK